MLYEALFTVATPSVLGPPLPTPLFEALELLLFTGVPRRRMATCAATSASVLAHTFAAIRVVPSGNVRPRFTVSDDTDEVVGMGSGIPSRLPPRWTTEPCAFGLVAAWEEGQFCQVVRVRLTPRHHAEQTAITGSVRVLWDPGCGGAYLTRRLAGANDAKELHDRLSLHGQRVVDHAMDRLSQELGGAASTRSRVVVLVGSDFDELLHGFPPTARAAVPEITRAIRGRWPALSDRGLVGDVEDGVFEPGAGAPDVV